MHNDVFARISESVLLNKYINPAYLHPSTLRHLYDTYHTPASPRVHLHNFLLPSAYTRILRSLRRQSGKRVYEPQLHSFSRMKGDRFFASHEFSLYLSYVMGTTSSSLSPDVKRFTWKDYTLSQPVSRQTHAAVLFLGGNIPEHSGGYWCCTTEQEEVFRVPPTPNSLALAFLQPPHRTFVKYLNSETKGKGLFTVCLSHQPLREI